MRNGGYYEKWAKQKDLLRMIKKFRDEFLVKETHEGKTRGFNKEVKKL